MLQPFKKIKKLFAFLFVLGFVFSPPSFSSPLNIDIHDVEAELLGPGKYLVRGSIFNGSDTPREITLRAQVTLYDRTSPKGDKPVSIIRKDFIIVLRTEETRELKISLLNEGTLPKGALRIEPMLRIRREREWMY